MLNRDYGEVIYPPINTIEMYRDTRDTYIEDIDKNSKCVTCKWCHPNREVDPYIYSHLVTDKGHFVSRIGYCYCQRGSVAFREGDGCRHFNYEPERKIIIESTLSYEEELLLKAGGYKVLEELRNKYENNSISSKNVKST